MMLDDLRFAWRRLRHARGFAIVAVLTLAVAVGATTAILSFADAVLFRPLPYQDSDRLFVLRMLDRTTNRQYTRVDLEYINLIDERHGGLGPVGLFDPGLTIRSVGPNGPISVPTLSVSPEYFRVLGVRAAHGRLFDEDDARASGRRIVLTYASWLSRFGADESIVGNSVTIGESAFEVIGVLPKGFIVTAPAGTFVAGNPEVVTVAAKPTPGTDYGAFHPVVRLEPGVTREQAQAELDVIGAEVRRANPNLEPSVPYLNDIRSILYPTGRPVMQFMLAAALLVLLLGCANLANVLLTRSRSRERETAMRSALGASGLRIVRSVLLEALLIGVAASVVAVVITAVTFEALRQQVPPAVYGNAPVGVDARLLASGLALGLISAVVVAAVPVWRTYRLDTQAVLQGRHRAGLAGSGRVGDSMVVVQVALAIVLVFGAGIAARAFVSVLRVPLGFDPERVLTIGPPAAPAGEGRVAFYARLLQALSARDDVVAAGGTGSLPLAGSAPYSAAVRLDTNEDVGGVIQVLPGYFEAVGIPLLRGRLLHWDDDRTAAVVSEAAARALFGDEEPLGRLFGDGRGTAWRVVGLVGDVRASLTSDYPPTAYALPGDRGGILFVVKTRDRSAATVESLRRLISGYAAGSGVSAVWWTDRISSLTVIRNPRFQTLVLSTFAAIALGLTALGIFAVVAFLVVSRSKEAGIRVAIGASPTSLVGLVVGQALMPIGLGLLIGLVATRLLARLAEAQLYDVNTHDPVLLASAATTVVTAALLAAYMPARRASRVDPVRILRAE